MLNPNSNSSATWQKNMENPRPPANLPALLNSDTIKNRFNEVLGKNAAGFMSALLNIYQSNEQLQKCEPRSILGAAGLAATLNLSITPTMGQAYVVPFKGKATFQVGVRGLIQLAHRTGQYEALHAGKVYEGQLRGFNPITGEPIVGEKFSDEIAGYVAYMRLNNGFEKTIYMTVKELEEHALTYSQSYRTDKNKGWNSSPWTTNFDAMASKTVLKKLLRQWGVLSADMSTAVQADQSVVDADTFTYVDNGGNVQKRDDPYARERKPRTEKPASEEPPALAEPAPEFVNPVTGEVQPELILEAQV